MTTPADVLALARSMVGYKEQANNCTYFGDWYSDTDRFHDEWCAVFVSYCFFTSGLPLAISEPKGFSYCPDGANWFKQHGAFHASPKSGDVVFFDWYKGSPACESPSQTNCSDAWHVGIVDEVLDANTIISIEGNMHNGVTRQSRASGVWYGFGRPNYNGVHFVSPLPAAPAQAIRLCDPPLTNAAIASWKHQMMERGWHFRGSPEVFDDDAKHILQKFQQEKHLAVDGELGPMSWRAAWELPVVA
jgi:hypothetical protein